MDDFLVVAGTAAPIIALANTVLVQPGLEGALTFHRAADDGQEEHAGAKARARRLSRVVMYGSILNLGAQAFVLFFVLFSLSPAFANKLGPVAQLVIVMAEIYGLIVLAIFGAHLGMIQALRREIEDAGRRKPGARARPPRRVVLATAIARPSWQRRASVLTRTAPGRPAGPSAPTPRRTARPGSRSQSAERGSTRRRDDPESCSA
jgi:hypothetical protein